MDSTKLSFIYRKKEDHGFYVDFHTHPETEIVFYFKGTGTININNKPYEFKEDSVSVINAGVKHDERHDNPSHFLFMSFHFDHFHIPDGVYQPKNFSKLKLLVEEIFAEKNSPKYAHNLYISSKINELIILLNREIISYDSHDKINDCMLYLKEHCNEDIDIKSIVEKRNLGYETFRHRFKKLYGMSPKNFILLHRLQKSCDLLIYSDKSCIDISYECGFSNSAQFSNFFKRQYGISPQQYRKNYKH